MTATPPSAHPPGRRPLGLASLLALGVNGIVGVGIFFAPREVATVLPGWGGTWVFVAVTFLLVPVGLVFARLGRAIPEDGGPYVYARAAFGPLAAFAVGWLTYVSALFSTGAVMVGLVAHSSASLGLESAWGQLAAELALLTVLCLGLSRGLRLSAILWSGVTVLKALPLVALPIAAVIGHDLVTLPARSPPIEGSRILAAALPVLFALQGFEVVPLPAAQVDKPKRNVPLATVGSLAIAGVLYVALHASCLLALPHLAAHDLPLADAAGVLGGEGFRGIMLAATTLSAFGLTIGMVAMTPRYLAPLGSERGLGMRLGEQNERGVPRRAFAVTYVLLFVILCANAGWGSLGRMLALSSISVTLQYAVTAGALFVLASRGEAGLSARDRWPAPLALFACALFLMGAAPVEIPIVLAMLSLGFVARGLAQRRPATNAM